VGNSLFLTIGALLLFGLFLLTGNRRIVEGKISADGSEYTMTAVSLAQSLIDEAKLKAFDEKSLAGAVLRSDLTNNSSLGKDGGAESVPVPDVTAAAGYASATKFDDVDDYKGYTRLVNTSRASNYSITVSVNYASETYPDSAKSVKTFCKKMTVTVTHPNIPSPVVVSYPFVY
jgi:hypothetical protein